ncbi:MAG: hydrolase [Rhodocyclaceae bacterium]|nr:hydrolase [Rhodocyclaceae bacterium]MBX3669332.1 hydrolase [Rhodocyclaceae bacterium]
MLMDRNQSLLLLIDLQERLLPHIDDWQRVLDNSIWLLQVAQKLGVPVLASEQYPKGLGHTHAELAALLPAKSIVTKEHFSCVAAACLPATGTERAQVVLAGVESHVCVLQTALELIGPERQVFVVDDAVGSREARSKELALERMRSYGVEIVSREMVAFEWLRRAGTDEFRTVSKEFLR